jgi:regulator of protease activity HflC (stomatin/prohibitin superfamily)
MADKLDIFKRKQSMMELKQTNPVALTLFFIVVLIGAGASVLVSSQGTLCRSGSCFSRSRICASSLKIANQWRRRSCCALVGRPACGPGLFWIVPIVEGFLLIDQRVVVTSFSAEKTLTMDTVPIDVDAVLFDGLGRAESRARSPEL